MKAKEKKHNLPTPLKKDNRPLAGLPLLAKNDIVPALLISLFFGVEFVPNLGAIDVMGSQWLYLVIVNFAVTVVMLMAKNKDYYAPVKRISSNALSLLYTGLFLVAGLSVFAALNKTESVVCYARFATSLVTYFNLALLLYGRLHMFRFFAQLFTLVLLISATRALIDFSKGYGNTDLNLLMLSITGNTGNKNILAASLTIKIPFAMYCIYSLKNTGKILNLLILLVATLAIFIINSRASYLALGFELLTFVAYCVWNYFKDKNIRTVLVRTSFVILPILFSFFLSQSIIKNALKLEGDYGTQNKIDRVGTVTERLESISFTAKGSGNRTLQWSSAWDYIQHHPWTGAGYGNWKLASIPYEKTFVNEMFITMHVHNDFLEIAAETGIIGGILFILIFLCASFYFFKAVFSKQDKEMGVIALFALMALAVYAIDATFNFPMERPVMQVIFMFILGLCVNIYLSLKKKQEALPKQGKARLLFVLLIFTLLVPAFYLTRTTYKSMVAQDRFAEDENAHEYKFSSEEVMAAFPEIPNLNCISFPIDAFKSTYLINEKKYKEALALLDKSANVNPALTLNDYLKAKIFNETGQLDSGYYYADKAFYNKPRARSNWYLLNEVCSKRNDTAGMLKAFVEFTRYRNESWAWNQYLSTLIDRPYKRENLLALCDSALKLFPGDKFLEQKKDYITQGPRLTSGIKAEQKKAASDYYTLAMEDYNRKDYANAAQKFMKASELNPNDYPSIEYAGVCYFFLNDYKTAMKYFDVVLQNFNTTDGKSEFLKGVCLAKLGDRKTGCGYLNMADAKHYPEAKTLLDIFCR